jgi:hypothetical protein
LADPSGPDSATYGSPPTGADIQLCGEIHIAADSGNCDVFHQRASMLMRHSASAAEVIKTIIIGNPAYFTCGDAILAAQIYRQAILASDRTRADRPPAAASPEPLWHNKQSDPDRARSHGRP